MTTKQSTWAIAILALLLVVWEAGGYLTQHRIVQREEGLARTPVQVTRQSPQPARRAAATAAPSGAQSLAATSVGSTSAHD